MDDRERFVPNPSLTREEMEALQHEIAAAARFADDPPRDPGSVETDLVAGVDQAFLDDRTVSAIVVLRDGEIVERVWADAPLEIPYIPGLLSFREGGSILAAFEALDSDPDLVLFDGSGRIHFRQAGLATHIGVTLDRQSIGVAKNLLCGHPRESLADPLPAGGRVLIEADDSVSAPTGTIIGAAVQTRQYDTGDRYINPVYVSPGHRVGVETAADCVEALCSGYKLPEPIRLADRYAGEVADDLAADRTSDGGNSNG
ncbi:MAG: endonuclease V [Halobacteriales archaeon]